jgi:hypothetical protein
MNDVRMVLAWCWHGVRTGMAVDAPSPIAKSRDCIDSVPVAVEERVTVLMLERKCCGVIYKVMLKPSFHKTFRDWLSYFLNLILNFKKVCACCGGARHGQELPLEMVRK